MSENPWDAINARLESIEEWCRSAPGKPSWRMRRDSRRVARRLRMLLDLHKGIPDRVMAEIDRFEKRWGPEEG